MAHLPMTNWLVYSSLAGVSLGTTPLLTKTLPRVRTEVSLAVIAYNMKRMIKIMGARGLVRAIAA